MYIIYAQAFAWEGKPWCHYYTTPNFYRAVKPACNESWWLIPGTTYL